jgi:subtilisin family serine protease
VKKVEFINPHGLSANFSRPLCREDFIGDFSATSAQQDCDGHGTHVASIAAGRSVGVAKEADVVAVRVLDCNGTGNATWTVLASSVLLG